MLHPALNKILDPLLNVLCFQMIRKKYDTFSESFITVFVVLCVIVLLIFAIFQILYLIVPALHPQISIYNRFEVFEVN